MLNSHIKKIIIVLIILAAIILSFVGLTILTMPLHTSQHTLQNKFVLDEEFKEVRKTLHKVDITKEALAMQGGRVLYEEVAHRELNLNGFKNWEFRQIQHIGVEVEDYVLHLKCDIHLISSRIDVLTTLRRSNTKIGLQKLRQTIFIEPINETQTLVRHESFIVVTRKCPTKFQAYMDKKVKEVVQKDIQIIEHLMRYYTEQ